MLSEKRKKLKARTANKVGYRDLVMSTEGISLSIVENAKSEELTKGDLKKAWDRLERTKVESKNQRRQSGGVHQIPKLQVRKHKTETHGLDNFHGKETSRTDEYRAHNE